MDYSIKNVLMKRDGMTDQEANDLIKQAKNDFRNRIENMEMSEDICEEWFGLEPDYIFDLI
jgi:hypothetical protein